MSTTSGEQILLLKQASAYAERYIQTLESRPVFPNHGALTDLDRFDEPFPENPTDPVATLALLDEIGSPATVAQTGGRYFGFVDGGALPVGIAARWLADAWDQNSALYIMSPVASRLEELCERWLVDLLHLPAGTVSGYVTGTTMANFSGLAAGRNELLRRQGCDVESNGLYGAPPLRVIVGADAHAAVGKSLSLLGMGDANTEVIPVDDQGRMRLDRFPRLESPALVVTQAGNVNSGGFDPVGEICEITHRAEGWVHVDGAFGLWAGAAPSLSHLYAGIEKADSWAVDAHKTLNVPYDCGIILCRRREALLAAFRASASYLQWDSRRDPMNFTPSMSRRARAIELWAVLKTLGRSGVAELVEQLCENARYFARRLADDGFRIHNDVVFNQILVSCGDDAETNLTLERLQSSGECWCGGSTWRGRAVIRISVCSWSTTREDIHRSVKAFSRARASSTSRSS